jgi:signal transduction histidine kinase
VADLRSLVTKRVETVKMMIFSSEIMRNLMMDLLDLAQMENNTFKLNKAYFSIHSTIQKVFSVVEHVAEKKNVALVFTPMNPREAMYYNAIYGDENRFIQVITNFLSNSLKFSNSGSQIVIFLKMLENQTLSVGDKQMK